MTEKQKVNSARAEENTAGRSLPSFLTSIWGVPSSREVTSVRDEPLLVDPEMDIDMVTQKVKYGSEMIYQVTSILSEEDGWEKRRGWPGGGEGEKQVRSEQGREGSSDGVRNEGNLHLATIRCSGPVLSSFYTCQTHR